MARHVAVLDVGKSGEEQGARKRGEWAVSENGRSVSGCGTVIPLRGAVVVF